MVLIDGHRIHVSYHQSTGPGKHHRPHMFRFRTRLEGHFAMYLVIMLGIWVKRSRGPQGQSSPSYLALEVVLLLTP